MRDEKYEDLVKAIGDLNSYIALQEKIAKRKAVRRKRR